MPVLLRGIEGIKAFAGFHLGRSSWLGVSQDMMNSFASATDDWDWLHVDEARAARGPFRRTIAHGYHTLSMAIPLLREIYILEDVGLGLNYGINRLRFPAPVPVDSNVRLDATLTSAEIIDDSVQMVIACVMECDASRKPVMVAELVFRYWKEMPPAASLGPADGA